MLAEFAQAACFYLCVLLLAGIALLVCRNVTLSPIVGLAGFGYLVWLAGTLHVISARNLIVWRIALAGAVGLSIAWVFRQKNQALLYELLRSQAAGFAAYLAFLWIRMHHGDISAGGEKIMDLAILASAGKADYFPFPDPWWGSLPINYYYFGQFLIALVANLCSVPISLAYNFGIALVFSFSVLLTYQLLRALNVTRFAATCGSLLVLGSSGIAFNVQWLRAYFTGATLPKWTTAVTYRELMQEMPAFSFLSGDLHAHVIGIPYYIGPLYVLRLMSIAPQPSILLWSLFGFLTAISTLVNSWNGITLALLYGLVLLFHFRQPVWWKYSLGMAASIVILMLPFLIFFRSPASGVGFAPTFAASHGGFPGYPTPLWMLANWAIWLAITAACAWKLRSAIRAAVPYWLILAAAGAIIMVGVELFYIKDLYQDVVPASFRSNTLFKFGVHSWILLTIATVAALQQAIRSERIRKAVFSVIALNSLLFPAVAIYQFYGLGLTPAVTSILTLDSLKMLQFQYRDATNAIRWVEANVPERKMIIEAACESYTMCGIVAAATGNRNPIQWKTHEWGWRLSSDGSKALMERMEDLEHQVRDVFQETDLARTRQVLDQLGADFVFVGDIERHRYGPFDESRFAKLGTAVYQGPSVRLYRVR